MNDAIFTLTDAATVVTGLMAGVYFIYAVAIMPGLRRLDDDGFVAAFQSTDRAIINPIFLVAFFAPAVLCGIAAFTEHGEPGYRWLVAALVLNAAIVVVTMAVNVPLNDALKARGDVSGPDAAAARQAFREGRWVAWNWFRTGANVGALVCLTLVS
ncbi:MAG TPA: anthrone oxygenase family protein [Aeromicrobium sp.]|nr:anthrone oxygenase family protein [Aeromicrobium sp.]